MDFLRLPTRNPEGALQVVVETPRGSRAKFKLDPDTRAFSMSRALSLGVHYPFDWGFVPSTVAADEDPLDALVIHDAVSFPGTVIPCRCFAILKVEQTQGGATFRNDRLICVPAGARRQETLDDLRALSPEMREELERFFVSSTLGTDKKLRFLGWSGAQEAAEAIANGARAFRESQLR